MSDALGAAPGAASPSAPAPQTPSAPAAPCSGPRVDLEGLLLEVVADKTGYPADMLSMEMSLEADLGIDSIKRVEILSAMTERAPELPEVDTSQMAALNTLGQIVGYMSDALGVSQPAAEAAPAAPHSGPRVDLEGLLLEVVADKTGYPADMLSMEMSLEADLGIDSIKRVEILSAMTERAPELPEVDTSQMAALNTLGQIVEYMSDALGGPAASKPEAAVVEDRAVKKPGRFVLEAIKAPATGLTMSGLGSARRVAITSDGAGIDAALAERLRARGLDALCTDTDFETADALIFLGGLDERGDALDVNRRAFEAARAVAGRFSTEGGVFVTVQDTGGDFGISGSERASFGGLPGLTKTAAQEWPRATARAVDIERGGRSAADIAAALLDELFEGGQELEVGLKAKGDRLTLQSVPASVPKGALRLGASDVVVASGGARGVTAATLIALARASRAHFVLLGRTDLIDEPTACAGLSDDASLKRALLDEARRDNLKITPAELGAKAHHILAAREIRATVSAIEAAGGKARYLALDVRDQSALSTALGAVRAEWGPITALVHGAGVLADRLIQDKTREQFDRVFDTKIQGLEALLGATASDPLTALVLFSSVAARAGNTGQCDYAMANEILNKVAQREARRRGDACLVRSLGWGPWEGGMVTPALKARFEAMGVELIPLDAGAAMLVDELHGDPSDPVEIVIGPAPVKRALLASAEAPEQAFDLVVDASSHPYLADHAIRNVPVVPVVLVLEWFARAAQATRPDLTFSACRDVKVLRGIMLNHFHAGGDRFQIHCRQITNGEGARLALELRSGQGTVHYTAIAEMTDKVASPSARLAQGQGAMKLDAWTAPIYGTSTLFHGPDFQVIRTLNGVSSEGLSAELVGTAQQGWQHSGGWRTDVAALDGGLQLALLWTRHMLGGDSLPTSVGSYKGYGSGLTQGPVHCLLQGRDVGRSKLVCDITFSQPDGQIVAELKDVTTHLLP